MMAISVFCIAESQFVELCDLSQAQFYGVPSSLIDKHYNGVTQLGSSVIAVMVMHDSELVRYKRFRHEQACSRSTTISSLL